MNSAGDASSPIPEYPGPRPPDSIGPDSTSESDTEGVATSGEGIENIDNRELLLEGDFIPIAIAGCDPNRAGSPGEPPPLSERSPDVLL